MTIPQADDGPKAMRFGPVSLLAAALIVSALAGWQMTWGAWWLVAAVPPFLLSLVAWRLERFRWSAGLALLTASLLMACWVDRARHHPPADHLRSVMAQSDQSRLARVRGRLQEPVELIPPTRQGLAKYQGWQPTQARLMLRVHQLELDGGWRAANGRLIVYIRQGDPVPPSWDMGNEVQLTGWLSPLHGPKNPGEPDWRRLLERHGIDGRFYLENWQTAHWLAGPRWPDRIWAMGYQLGNALSESLDLGGGLSDDPKAVKRRALLQAILLGRYQRELGPLQQDFRQTGLVHILTISGAHLAMFTAMVWWMLGLWPLHPRTMALLTLAILLTYVWVLPWQIPVIRSAVMAGLLLLGYGSGRRVLAIELLSLAAIGVLLVSPLSVTDPGTQLSFAITAGLLLLTRPLTDRWSGSSEARLTGEQEQSGRWLTRAIGAGVIERVIRGAGRATGKAIGGVGGIGGIGGVGGVAANVIGFVIAMPLVAFHFSMVNAWSVLLSILAMPLAWMVLALGYLKMLLGLAIPALGVLLAWPTDRAADGLIALVSMASRWPGSGLELGSPASLGWTLTALVVGVVWLAPSRLTLRPLSSARNWRPWFWCVVALLTIGWLWIPQRSPWRFQPGASADLQMRLTMIAVGDGSCYVMQWRDTGSSRSHVWMFDCGSSRLDGLVDRRLMPALAAIGVDQVDTLLLSHVDLDHIGGSVDLARRLPVKRLLVSAPFLDHAASHPQAAAALLLAELGSLGPGFKPAIETVGQGWRTRISGLTFDILWPGDDMMGQRPLGSNDLSLVMSVSGQGWRLMLSGDIQQKAIVGLLDHPMDLKADVVDLPHHGSWVRASADWLKACDPRLVLQSSGPSRLRQDAWSELLGKRPRLITQRDGLSQVEFFDGGRLAWRTFCGDPQTWLTDSPAVRP